ncbi:uncharacterized protein LOC120624679 [Pararge aegeria]|uniref:Jg20671 protein n=1 Tax=Pararge aegeria aegeria TaxID=348720 RepID=A0A8S4R2W8_9NEOP|nr:uncharacterized protein LOC120624679 [Pararge aegeria]CAH2230194.1 jg20671 [Pararge aegeria aegeria]
MFKKNAFSNFRKKYNYRYSYLPANNNNVKLKCNRVTVKMSSTKRLKLLLYIFLVILFVYYALWRYHIENKKTIIKDIFQNSSSENIIDLYNQNIEESQDQYLINTPGCSIPNYLKTYKIEEAKYVGASTCGVRAVFIKKISNEEIAFSIDKMKIKHYTKGKSYSCCYQFATPAIVAGKEDYRKQRYSKCTNFDNNSNVELKNEVITVTCSLDSSKKRVIYEDAYIILKRLHRDAEEEQIPKKPWNVLVLGLDTVSRARVYNSMPKTVKYMLQNDWLDYRAYQKVGYNTFPNLMSLLTGKRMTTIYKTCSSSMDNCNHLMLWSEFKKKGYITATGEDDLKLPDTFSKRGYKSAPTDHYLRPLFLTGERSRGNIICTKMLPSAQHILDYASNFTESYKDENFFGFFWLNSYSHNLENIPTLIDKNMVNFFTKLNNSGVLQNTFIYFLSDHGLRSGKMRVPYESYYDERLPMLFLWVPTEFRNIRPEEYNNLKFNQHRLITPYDLYLTLLDTLTVSKESTDINSEACPNCTSIFNNIDIHRTCEEAGVDEQWCSCHGMTEISHTNDEVVTATNVAVVKVQNKVSTVKTIHCMKCEMLKLKKILRSHTYRNEYLNKTYFVIAFVMSPGDVAYEVKVVKHNETFSPFQEYTISVYNIRGRCAIEQNDRAYCVCVSNCTKKG